MIFEIYEYISIHNFDLNKKIIYVKIFYKNI